MALFNHFVCEIFDENHKFNSLRSDHPPQYSFHSSHGSLLHVSDSGVLVTFLQQKWIIFIRCRFYGRPFILSINLYIDHHFYSAAAGGLYDIFFCFFFPRILLFRGCWARKMDCVICVSQRSIKYSTGFYVKSIVLVLSPVIPAFDWRAARTSHKKKKDIHIYLSYFLHKTEITQW